MQLYNRLLSLSKTAVPIDSLSKTAQQDWHGRRSIHAFCVFQPMHVDDQKGILPNLSWPDAFLLYVQIHLLALFYPCHLGLDKGYIDIQVVCVCVLLTLIESIQYIWSRLKRLSYHLFIQYNISDTNGLLRSKGI